MISPRHMLLLAAVLTVAAVPSHVARSADRPAKSIDLLRMINPARQSVKGQWAFVRGALISDATQLCQLQVPYLPPQEYDIEIEAERLRGNETLGLAVPIGPNQPEISIDGWRSTISGISSIDGKFANENDATFHGRVFPDTGAITLIYRIRIDRVVVFAGEKKIIDWKGEPRRLSFSTHAEFPEKRAIGLVTWSTSYRITRMDLTPVTGEGERVR